ncbi:hypothetical protein I6F36_24140 [Bradyrhizobium sp. BRP19]|uniref:hypothetical protein n=1 Tax=Bradyrhizobium sp. BRP19 TaxID=2793823 RepID=UPI001CD407E6|nr:hypothetical protein [Bradyrhizobium sp. BRP19]MCA1549926.1 hypothetical protein [Bradyrhizobium sp. BRP19]
MTQRNMGAPPARVCARPDPSQWSDDELMTLSEAAALFWPMGPLTCTSLRTAVRDGKLEVAEIAGKLLTSKTSIRKMAQCTVRADAATAAPAGHQPPPETETGAPRSVAEFRRMMAEGRL